MNKTINEILVEKVELEKEIASLLNKFKKDNEDCCITIDGIRIGNKDGFMIMSQYFDELFVSVDINIGWYID